VRVALDTNIFLSALLSERGPPAAIVDAWRAGRFELVTSVDQISEFKRVTRYPKLRAYMPRGAVGLVVNGLRTAEVMLKRLPGGATAPDPGDDYLIAMAMASSAHFLVSGDREVLSMLRVGPTRIVSAQRFISLLAR
jgi:putative PIN family toxin of toxin-antitoxin system